MKVVSALSLKLTSTMLMKAVLRAFRNLRKLRQQRGRKTSGLLPVAKKGRPSLWFAAFRQHVHIFRRFKQALQEVQTSNEMKKRKKENKNTQKKKALKVGRK